MEGPGFNPLIEDGLGVAALVAGLAGWKDGLGVAALAAQLVGRKDEGPGLEDGWKEEGPGLELLASLILFELSSSSSSSSTTTLAQARQCLLQAKITNIYTNIVKTDNKSGIIQDGERQRWQTWKKTSWSLLARTPAWL